MLQKQLLVSITGYKKNDWQNKLREITKYHIKEIGLFMEAFPPRQRQGLLSDLKKSCVKKIPLVHIRQDTTKQEIKFLIKNFGSRYFTIHESHFPILKNWRGYYKNLYLELNTDNRINKYVQVKKIGGFCTDLAHFEIETVKQSREFRYTVDRIGKVKIGCNHLSGYSRYRNTDLHTVTGVKQFDYIKKLPHVVFGNVIAFEIFNSIKDQLCYYPHVKKILQGNLGFKIL